MGEFITSAVAGPLVLVGGGLFLVAATMPTTYFRPPPPAYTPVR